jgi:hypothetical protein
VTHTGRVVVAVGPGRKAKAIGRSIKKLCSSYSYMYWLYIHFTTSDGDCPRSSSLLLHCCCCLNWGGVIVIIYGWCDFNGWYYVETWGQCQIPNQSAMLLSRFNNHSPTCPGTTSLYRQFTNPGNLASWSSIFSWYSRT